MEMGPGLLKRPRGRTGSEENQRRIFFPKLYHIVQFLRPSGLLLGPCGVLNENGRLVHLNAWRPHWRRPGLIGGGVSQGVSFEGSKTHASPSLSASCLWIRLLSYCSSTARGHVSIHHSPGSPSETVSKHPWCLFTAIKP